MGAITGAAVGSLAGPEGAAVGAVAGHEEKKSKTASKSSKPSFKLAKTSGNTGMKLLIAEFFICMVVLGLSGLSGGTQQTQPQGPAQNTPAPQGPNQ